MCCLLILAISILQTDPIRSFKAPRNEMFLVHGTYCMVRTASSNVITILGKSLPADASVIIPIDSNDGIITTYTTDTVGNFEHTLRSPEKVKIISVGREGGGAFDAIVIINYEFVSATKSELLWEFLRNFRR